GKHDRVCTDTPSPTVSHAAASSSTTCRYTSYGWPPPPYSPGYSSPSSPPSPRVRYSSRGNLPVASPSAARGASSLVASSLVSSKSSPATSVGSTRSTAITDPSPSGGDDHQRARAIVHPLGAVLGTDHDVLDPRAVGA